MKSGRSIKIAICDDETAVTDELRQMLFSLAEAKEINLKTAVFLSPVELVLDAEAGVCFDVVFMDIDWEGHGKGIDASERLLALQPNAAVIYITGYSEKYVQQIFLKPANLIGFLKKPIDRDILASLFDKAIKSPKIAVGGAKFSFSNRNGTYSIDFSDIIFLESKGHRLSLHTKDGICHEINGKLDDVEDGFPHSFVRCHKSYIINMAWADYIDKKQHKFIIDRSKLLSLNEEERLIPISKFRYKEARDRFIKYLKLKG